MFRKTLIAFVLSLINAKTKLTKIFLTGSDRGYDISWNGSVMVRDLSYHTTSQICKRGGNTGIHKSGV